eukprot:7894722-Pyramimonas_sp.AAC.1
MQDARFSNPPSRPGRLVRLPDPLVRVYPPDLPVWFFHLFSARRPPPPSFSSLLPPPCPCLRGSTKYTLQ